jgi:hypothetical protein
VRVSPSADRRFFVHERQKQGRAQRYPTPVDDPLVKSPDNFAYFLLRGQVLDRFRQQFDLFAQPQRGGQELLGRHALSAQVVPQPGLAVICLSAVRKGLTGAGQIIEGTPLRRLVDLLVNPRGEADPWRLALCHMEWFPLYPGGLAGQRAHGTRQVSSTAWQVLAVLKRCAADLA